MGWRKGTAAVSAPYLTIFPKRALATGVLCALLGMGAAGPTPAAAWADEAPAPAGAVTRGVCDALDLLQLRIDAEGQLALDEKALEHARRTDAVAEELRLQALNSKGQEYSAAAGAAAQQAREAQQAAEQAAAEAAARTRESAPVNETSSTPPPTFTNTLYFHGEYVPFVQGNPADMTAPKARVASTWIGEGDVDDDENTYFIGHNPGVFSGVMNLQVGDEIVVWDSTGASRSYFVFDTLVLPNASNYFAYEGRLSPRGESITLQTCVADDQNVRCVMAH